jgi:hypothetical protein
LGNPVIVLGLSVRVKLAVWGPVSVPDPVAAPGGEMVQPVTGVPEPVAPTEAFQVTDSPPLLLMVNVGHELAVQMPCSLHVVPV